MRFFVRELERADQDPIQAIEAADLRAALRVFVGENAHDIRRTTISLLDCVIEDLEGRQYYLEADPQEVRIVRSRGA